MILAAKNGDRTVRSSDSLGHLLELRGGRSAAGVSVNARTVGGLPAATRAISTAAQSVAALWRGFGVWRGEGVDRRRIGATWQAKFFAGPPNDRGESWFDVWEQTERSLTGRNNAYWYMLRAPDTSVQLVYVLAPGDVDVNWDKKRGRKVFRFRPEQNGPWSEWLDSSSILHFRALNEPGCLTDPSPIDLHREALGAAIAKTKYEARFYERDVKQHLAITFPATVTREQAQDWKELYEAEHSGPGGDSVSVFGGGATAETIGLSLQDAQYIESMQFSVEEISRIYGVHASLIGGGTQGNSKDAPITPEHEQDRWQRYGLGPRLERIEAVLTASLAFFGPGARSYPMFAPDRPRADQKTEAEIAVKKVQAGIWTPDEARATDGLGPHPAGVGAIPQITPVGGAPNDPALAL